MKGKIFNAQEVQSILNGSKVMFREVIKEQPPHDFKTTEKTIQLHNNIFCNTGENYDFYFGVAPYRVGQKIFCKEVFCKSIFGKAIYKDEEKEIRNFGGKEVVVKWKPAQHMKQEHSRITLEITSIKVERLQDISYEDAIKEGVWNIQEKGSPRSWDVINAFRKSWNATHKKPEEKFDANPFVWVVDFKINK